VNATTSEVSVTLPPVADATPLSLAAWRIVAGNFAEALYWLRLEEPFDALDPCQWDVLRVILSSLCLGSSSPTQAELAFHAGYCVRSIRQSLAELKRTELLRAAGGGGAPVTFDIGPRLTAFLRDFAFTRDARIWRWTSPVIAVPNHPPTPAPHAARIADAPALHAGEYARTQALRAARILDTPALHTQVRDTPAPHAGVTRPTGHDESRHPLPIRAAIPSNFQRIRGSERFASAIEAGDVSDDVAPEAPPSLIKKKEEDLNSFSSSEGGPTPATQPHPCQPVDAATARRLALDALATRFRRAHVGIPLPRACDAADVKLVEACTANGTWDVETLRQTHLDAIEGAFDKAPPDRPPTPRYIWGQFRFFLAHASVGRAKRLRAEVAPKPKKVRLPEDPPASSEWLEQHMREASARLATLPDVSIRKRQLRFGDDLE
jgi:hypothetical protein